jgi:hypothetical protein
MSLFYFHFLEGTTRHADEVGLELADAETAYLQAVAAAQGMSGELIADGVNPSHCAFEISDAEGTILFALEFSELFRRGDGSGPNAGHATERLSSALADTHRRVAAARGEIAASLMQARTALNESHALLARLKRFER